MFKVLFLKQAELDLKELKNYLINRFSVQDWQVTYKKIKESVNSLKLFPKAGHIPPELSVLNLTQYKQIISGMNRIIYEIRENTIYIHIVCDARKDMASLLLTRLLRSD